MLLRKGVYPYEYMDNWERFDETTLSNKKGFYSELDLKDITNKDYAYAQKVFEEFKVKNLLILYGWQIYLKTLETCGLKYINLILLIFCMGLD